MSGSIKSSTMTSNSPVLASSTPSAAGGGNGDAVIFGAEAAIDEVGDARLVFDQKHVHAPSSARCGRQCDRDGGPFAQTARHFDPSFMGLDDGLGHRQTKPKPLVVHRGGIAAAAETLKNSFELLRRDADAAIGDAHP